MHEIRTVGTLGTKALGHGTFRVRQARNLLLTLLDNNAVQGLNIGADNAAAHRLPAALTVAARAVARVTGAQKQAHTVGQENTLLHRETLLVVTTADAENVTLPLVTKRVDLDILGHALVVEATHETLVQELKRLLRSRGRVGNVQLHLHNMLAQRRSSSKALMGYAPYEGSSRSMMYKGAGDRCYRKLVVRKDSIT